MPDATKSSMSDIACCNYVARDKGVRNGILLGQALELCPDLVTIPYDFEAYKEVAVQLYETVVSYTLDVEAVSCDELYVDCATVLQNIPGLTAIRLAESIRKDIETKTGCTCSIGIAKNFVLARMATRKAKPNGVFYLEEKAEREFLAKQPVSCLPGVGRLFLAKLKSLNVETCGDLLSVSMPTLRAKFGPKYGQNLFNMCRGIDRRQIKRDQTRQSVSAEINYGIRFQEFADFIVFVNEIAMEVEKRLKSVGTKGKTITVKLKIRSPEAPIETEKFMGHGWCDSLSRSSSLKEPTNDGKLIAGVCQTLLRQINPVVSDIRGIGIQVTKLSAESSSSPQKLTIVDMLKTQKQVKKKSIEQSSTVVLNENLENEVSTANVVEPQSIYPENSNDKNNCDNDDPIMPPNINIDEAKSHLKLWVTSHEVPLQEDIEIFSEFVRSIIADHNLEKADLLLKYFLRLITHKSDNYWTSAAKQVVFKVQEKMKEMYGGHLRISLPA